MIFNASFCIDIAGEEERFPEVVDSENKCGLPHVRFLVQPPDQKPELEQHWSQPQNSCGSSGYGAFEFQVGGGSCKACEKAVVILPNIRTRNDSFSAVFSNDDVLHKHVFYDAL